MMQQQRLLKWRWWQWRCLVIPAAVLAHWVHSLHKHVDDQASPNQSHDSHSPLNRWSIVSRRSNGTGTPCRIRRKAWD